MNRPSSERRRRLVVDRDLQVRLVGRIALAFVGSLLLFLAISLGAPMLLGAVTGASDWGLQKLVDRVKLLVAFVALPLSSGVLVLFAVGIRSTFGVAGPLYRFGRVFRDLAALRLPRGVRIRRDDLLQETARLFDEALVALHDHAEKLQQRAVELARELGAAAELEPALAGSLAPVQERVAELEAECRRFLLLPRAPYDESKVPAPKAVEAPEPLDPLAPQPTSRP